MCNGCLTLCRNARLNLPAQGCMQARNPWRLNPSGCSRFRAQAQNYRICIGRVGKHHVPRMLNVSMIRVRPFRVRNGARLTHFAVQRRFA